MSSRGIALTPRRAASALGLLAVLGGAAVLLACMIGSVSLSAPDLLHALPDTLFGQAQDLAGELLDLRMKRALAAFATGATLALAGVMMQTLLRNPLADPYVLGVSGGAAVGALSALLLTAVLWQVDLAAFVGALAVALLLYGLAHRDLRMQQDTQAPVLILTGVVIASGCGALITLILTVAPDSRLRSMVFWLIGDLSGAQSRIVNWGILFGVAVLVMRQARALNLLAMHGEHAAQFGIDVVKLRRVLFFGSALLTASAVSSAGSVGFVGLIVPHACRFTFASDHRLLLPASMLAGGGFLVLADTLSRTVAAPMQLPVGVVTAAIGVPAFLLQLHHVRKR